MKKFVKSHLILLIVLGGITLTAVSAASTSLTYVSPFQMADNSTHTRFYISNSGNVGISTMSPQNKLDVNGSLAVGTYAGTNSATSNGAIISGRLGLGTVNPSHELSVLMSNSGIEPGASILANNEIAVASPLESTATYIFNQNGTSGVRGINAYNDTSRMGLPLYLGWFGGNVYIAKDGGNVGIGTINPQQALEVNGGIRISTNTSQPTCNSSSDGTFWVVKGSTGVKDSVQVCAKDASNNYAWRTIY